jgi:CheY-like chemotaxis protein
VKEKPVLFVKRIPSTDSTSGESSLSAKLLEAQDDERRKISRELHDSVGQSLTAAKIGLAKLKSQLRATELPSLTEVEEMVDGALAEVRTVSYLLHPPVLDLMGLRTSIVWYAEGFEQRTGIRTSVEGPELLPQFETATETTLFRIVQESLTNVHKHAMASAVTISVTAASDEFQLKIHDDGAGFGENCREGVGIGGMRERLKEINGTLEIRSRKQVGSSIVVTIPLRNAVVSIHSTDSAGPPAVPTATHRILLVDQQELLRRGVRSLLASETDLKICGEAASAEEALEFVKKLRPDVIVLDLQLPGHNGWWMLRELKKIQLLNNVVILSQYDLPQFQYAAKLAGCSGFVSKSRASEHLVAAICAALEGGTFFDELSLGNLELSRGRVTQFWPFKEFQKAE